MTKQIRNITFIHLLVDCCGLADTRIKKMAKIMKSNINFVRPSLTMTELIDSYIEQHIAEVGFL